MVVGNSGQSFRMSIIFWRKWLWKSAKCDLTFVTINVQNMKFSIKNFFSKCDQIRRKLQIWSHLLKKSLMENSFFVQWISPDNYLYSFLFCLETSCSVKNNLDRNVLKSFLRSYHWDFSLGWGIWIAAWKKSV